MVSSTRNPLYLALEWATLDVISGGRTILGTGMGNPEEGVRREFEALGLDYVRRGAIFEEGLAVLRELWTTGSVTFHGRYFDYEGVSFYSGTELGPLRPVPTPRSTPGARSASTSRSTTPSSRRRWTCRTGARSEPPSRSPSGSEPLPRPASTTSSAGSARSTSSTRSSGSPGKSFQCSPRKGC